MNLPNMSAKQKQIAKVCIVAGIALLIIVLGMTLTGKKPEKKEEEQKKDRKFSILSEKVEKDLWIAAEGQNIKALEKSNQDLWNEMERLRKELAESRKKAEQVQQKPAKMPPVPPPLPEKEKPVPPEKRKPDKITKGAKGEPPAGAIKIWQSEVKASDRKEKVSDEHEVWIPTGSITKAVLLSGMDVPTSLNAKSEPYPILMMLSDYSLLPNRFRMDVKECFLIGAGYGNVVEERAYIRTETLSCIRSDGTPWEVSLKGQVMGEDGKLGLRGKVISKQGSQIAMSIVTGVLSGLGQALRPQTAMSFVQLEKKDNQVTTLMPNLSDVALGAGLTGMGTALNRISEYYLKLAEQMYPVIEVDAGRQVEVVVVKGGKLSPKEDTKASRHASPADKASGYAQPKLTLQKGGKS